MTQISDTGIGIKEEDLSKIFRVFGKLTGPSDINQSGMGLGLSISKLIVEKLGGTISIESQWAKGTRFTFSIMDKGLALFSESEGAAAPQSERKVTVPLFDPLPSKMVR